MTPTPAPPETGPSVRPSIRPSLTPSRSSFPPEPQVPIRVLVVDDDAIVRRGIARALKTEGFVVDVAHRVPDALALVEQKQLDVVLADLAIGGGDGLELMQAIKEAHPDVEVVLMTAHGGTDVAVKALRNGAQDFLSKPFPSAEVVVVAVAKAAERRRLLLRMQSLERELDGVEAFEDLVGSSKAMRKVYRLATGVARTLTTVLLLGESGTGKELVARAIHRRSRRSDKPFIAVNCAAIPTELIDSELFGHARGAFTGATADRAGLFEEADGGTIFLDEVGDLPLPAQAKLLRALQQGEVKRVGANRITRVDARVVAATNADLKRKIKDGSFREDLYYRLKVVAIALPPLRERKDDIPLLAFHFLRKYARRAGRDVTRIGVDAMQVLREHSWPGNVRELENAVEHGVVMAQSSTIAARDLPHFEKPGDDDFGASGMPGLDGAVDVGSLHTLPYAEAKRVLLGNFERAYLEAVLRNADGNVARAAKIAGLDRSNFRRLIKRPR